MDGKRASLMATDPPYLVDYDGGNHPRPGPTAATSRRPPDDGTSTGTPISTMTLGRASTRSSCGPPSTAP